MYNTSKKPKRKGWRQVMVFDQCLRSSGMKILPLTVKKDTSRSGD